MKTQFKNIIEILDYFNDEKKCKELLAQQRWEKIPVCPFCGNKRIYITNRGYKCATCHKKFTVTVGTIFENSKIKLRYWFAAIYLVTAHKKGISSHQLARDLGVTQKTAWFMLQRIREILKDSTFYTLKNIIEIDETFIGGKRGNKHKKEREKLAKNGEGYVDMTPIVGMLERDGKIKTVTISGHKVNGGILKPIVLTNIAHGSTIITDGFGGYKGLCSQFKHEILEHSKDEYVRGKFHTNTIEGFWSLMKRGIIGIYHWVSPSHLHRYCIEFTYRYNTKNNTDVQRFMETLKLTSNARLTYNQLTMKMAA